MGTCQGGFGREMPKPTVDVLMVLMNVSEYKRSPIKGRNTDARGW